MRSVITVRVHRHMTLREGCKVMGFAQTEAGQRKLKRRIIKRVKEDPTLKKWDPRSGVGPKTKYRLTRVILKKIFHEHFDDEVEIGAEIRRRIEDLHREIDALNARIEQANVMSRGRDDLLAKHIDALRHRRTG